MGKIEILLLATSTETSNRNGSSQFRAGICQQAASFKGDPEVSDMKLSWSLQKYTRRHQSFDRHYSDARGQKSLRAVFKDAGHSAGHVINTGIWSCIERSEKGSIRLTLDVASSGNAKLSIELDLKCASWEGNCTKESESACSETFLLVRL